MNHPTIIAREILDGENGDLIIVFRFDGDLLPDPTAIMEFDRSQYLDGEPAESVYDGLPRPLVKIIKQCFDYPRMDPHRHARVAQREVTLTLDPTSSWQMDLDPVGHFTYHYDRFCRRRLVRH